MTGLTVEGNRMDGMGQGESQNFNPGSAAPVVQSQPAHEAPVEQERTFRQSEVNDIAARRASEAVDRYKRETSVASHQPQSYQRPETYQAPQQPAQKVLSEDDAKRIASEETKRQRNEWIQESHRQRQEQEAQTIASEFFQKVGVGEGGLDSFHKKVAESGLDLRAIPYHVQLANKCENTKEIMDELLNNPTKIGLIQNLIDIDVRAGREPMLAFAEMKRMGAALKENAKGQHFKAPNEPLSQLRPSNSGADRVGANKAGDYKRNPKYKV